MWDKIRQYIIKKLLKDTDGYIYIGLENGEPINFYYDENINKYVFGERNGNTYYNQINCWGITEYMSRYLDWDNIEIKEPKIVPFKEWFYGVLDQINQEYMKALSK